MSLPLPLPTYPPHNNPPNASTQYLSVEERLEVYIVKAAERPHLLNEEGDTCTFTYTSNDTDEEKKTDECSQADQQENGEKDEHADEMTPIIDGCDIVSWRRAKLGYIPPAEGSAAWSIAHVGSGNAASIFLRRTSQWPVLRMHAPECIFKNPNGSSVAWTRLRYQLQMSPNKHAVRLAERVQYNEECIQSFAMNFEERNVPAIILGAADDWAAMLMSSSVEDARNEWTFENLLSRFGDVRWRFSDQHGEMMELSTYARYVNAEGRMDDSPLAIYDAEFGHDAPTDVLLEEYTVPKCFSRDLFEMVDVNEHEEDEGERPRIVPLCNRPPYRWILIGPERSGTGLHVDPLYTNAWVTVLQGQKRWLLFPPCTPPEKIGMVDGEPQIPSSIWFCDYYEKVTNPAIWPKEWQPVEVFQQAGETVFVPNGWAHLVLNLEFTVAVTHNYASEFGPFESMWKQVVNDEPEFARCWYQAMKKQRPDLAKRMVATGVGPIGVDP